MKNSLTNLSSMKTKYGSKKLVKENFKENNEDRTL